MNFVIEIAFLMTIRHNSIQEYVPGQTRGGRPPPKCSCSASGSTPPGFNPSCCYSVGGGIPPRLSWDGCCGAGGGLPPPAAICAAAAGGRPQSPTASAQLRPVRPCPLALRLSPLACRPPAALQPCDSRWQGVYYIESIYFLQSVL